MFRKLNSKILPANLLAANLQTGGGGILYGDYFARENFGGGISPPLGIPKLQLLPSRTSKGVVPLHYTAEAR